MHIKPRLLLLVLLLASLTIIPGGCTCGFSCSSDSADNSGSDPALFTLNLSDSLPEDLREVVIEITQINLKRDNLADLVIEEFDGQASITVDLLQYPGSLSFPVIEDFSLEPDFYDDIELVISSGDTNTSHVLENTGAQRQLDVANDTLSLGGVELLSGQQNYTAEFDLARALQYRDADSSYLLTSDGVRLQFTDTAASVAGTIDTDLFDTEPECSEKALPESGNRVYLYQGRGLDADTLGDTFTQASNISPPAGTQAPFAVANLGTTLTRGWEYALAFLPDGDYTIAFACDSGDDDPVEFDDIVIPQPPGQIYEVTLSAREDLLCNLTEDPGTEC